MSVYRIDFAALAWEAPMPGLRFKAMKHEGRQLRLVEYTKEMPPHWCEKGHIGYVLEGRFEIKYENAVEIYNPGDGIFIPPGNEHKHMGKALTDIVRIVFVEDA
jgi:quercetin dioxygenase-like cupin family protein